MHGYIHLVPQERLLQPFGEYADVAHLDEGGALVAIAVGRYFHQLDVAMGKGGAELGLYLSGLP
jgi:hypothetical protein